MAMTKSELIKSSDFFIITVRKNGERVFWRYYKTFEQANEAFARLRSATEHQLIQGITKWTDNIYNAWKKKDPNYEKIRKHIESIWTSKYGLHQCSDKLYKGDVWGNINACLRAEYLTPLHIKRKEDIFFPDDTIEKFYADSLTFFEDKKNSYAFYLDALNFAKDVDEPRQWMAKEGIKCK